MTHMKFLVLILTLAAFSNAQGPGIPGGGGGGGGGSVACAGLPALTGDATSSAGSCATLVKQIHDTITALTFGSSPYTVVATDSVLTCDATGGAVVINLPAATGTGRELTLKKIDSSSNACTLTRAAADVIDGATTAALSIQYASSKLADSSAGTWIRTHVNQQLGDVTGVSTATVVGKINGTALSGLATGILKNTTGTGVPSIATAGTDYLSSTVQFPNAATTGSLVVFDANNSATINFFWPGGKGGAQNTCSGGTPVWPVGGWVRKPTLNTSGANGAGVFLRGGQNVNCTQSLLLPQPTGLMVQPAAAAGAFTDNATSALNDMSYVPPFGQLGFSTTKQGAGGTAAVVSNGAVEFVADTAYTQVIASSANTALTASTNAYWPPVGGIGAGAATTAALTQGVPFPIAGTISNLIVCAGVQPSNTFSPVIHVNGATTATPITVTIASTDTSQFCYSDLTHTAAIAAGDYVSIFFPSGAATQSFIFYTAFSFTPTSGTASMILGEIGATVSVTATYALPGSGRTSTTAANAKVTMPFGCTLSTLQVVMSTDTANDPTFTVQIDGADTAITGTATAVGTNTVYNGAGVAITAGQTLSLKHVAGGVSGIIGGWGLKCQP